MDPDASASDLVSVEHDIVSLRAHFPEFPLLQERKVLFHGHGKRMVHGEITSLLIAPLELRELCDPHKAEFIFI